MLKFIKHNLETIAGVEIYPIISLLIFFTFFVGLFFWVFTYNKDKIKELSELPIKDEL
ncbi:CcoQ/FixQ family Cbb3-type cytochrome c oxidase assembly chaperone [Flavobacterium chuncheonense]|uniref:CcoQ/FixQ family Cbb3-type cytochrome c oxidase assembly chaperone n=1 Tax=Flavobacterium chuncheonense TaxID=2026653 RepID=A0ABW5YNZ8_9FLAO